MEKNLSDFTSNPQYKNFLRAIIIIGIVVAVGVTTSLLMQSKKTGEPIAQIVKTKKFEDVVRQSNNDGDPKPLQDYLITKLKKGENDNETKSAIYWITHRYFDNGGDIYEIYSFVKNHPEVAFLNEAEERYPTIFAQIQEGKIEKQSTASLQALLAYYDVIDRKGYGDIALWGIAANKYSELALSVKTIKMATTTPDGKKVDVQKEREKFLSEFLNKTAYYVNIVDRYLVSRTGDSRDLTRLELEGKRYEDILAGLNQYMNAVQNLKGIGFTKTTHPYSVKDLYEYSSKLSQDKAGRLYFFTQYVYATGLLSSKEATRESVKVPLDRILDFVKTVPESVTAPHSSIARVINSRNTNDVSIYAKKNAVELAKLHVGFKDWLKSNGWTDEDFK